MEVDQLNEIDWNHVFDDLPPSSLELDSAAVTANQTVESWIEELLMKDDDDEQQAIAGLDDDFMWSDLLLDSPQVDLHPSDDKNSASCSNSDDNVNKTTNYDCGNSGNGNGDDIVIPNHESNGENDKSGDDALELDDTDDDPLSKKRKRQLRNRDAALRSRERKKMYVTELEMKSRYMEAECRRLGRLLQCCYSENQMLRISLGSAYGASMTKPESAVLSLESLLLVSLVWLMVNICLLPLPRLPLLNQDAVPHPHGSVERKNLESATPNGKGTKVIELSVTFSFMRSKRCSASRIKMKPDFDPAVVCP